MAYCKWQYICTFSFRSSLRLIFIYKNESNESLRLYKNGFSSRPLTNKKDGEAVDSAQRFSAFKTNHKLCVKNEFIMKESSET